MTKKAIRAHRNILSACSPVFKDILQMSTQSNHPVIYLRGMQSSEIESILQFMYFGEAKFYKERMDEYLSVVKELEIKELSKAVDTSDQQPDYTPDEAIEESEKDCNESTENYATDDDIITKYEAEIVGSDNEQTEAGKPNSGESKFQCKQCHKTYSDLSGLWYHKKSKHEGVKYACNQCDYQATSQSHLKTHIQSKHEGVKFACNQCDQQFTQQSSLTTHIQSQHKGVKYACNQCNYQTARNDCLTLHIQSKHKGIKYPCNQCNYQATYKNNLKSHIKRNHL